MERDPQKSQEKSVEYTSIRKGSRDSTNASLKRKLVSEYIASPAESNIKGHPRGLLSKISQ